MIGRENRIEFGSKWLIFFYVEIRPILVVVPAAVKHHWAKEFEKWFPSIEQNIGTHVAKKIEMGCGKFQKAFYFSNED